MLLAFALVSGGLLFAFGRRRRASAPGLLATAAVGATSGVVAPMRAGSGFRPQADDDEAGVPRWLRQSIRAERFWTPARGSAGRPVGRRRPATFADGAPEGTLMTLRYDDVTILDQPSDSYGRPTGRAHTGDEVVVVATEPGWAMVQAPSGVSGWLPSMTLVAVQAAVEVETPHAEAP